MAVSLVLCHLLKNLGFRLLISFLNNRQTASTQECTTHHAEEDIDILRGHVTANVLERWAEPLEQYFSTIQLFVSCHLSYIRHKLRNSWIEAFLKVVLCSGTRTPGEVAYPEGIRGNTRF